MKKTAYPVQTVGIYSTIQAASRQEDILMQRSSPDVCVNIVQSEKGYRVQTVVWK